MSNALGSDQKFIFEYLRDRHRTPVGIIVALKTGPNSFAIGWSVCKLRLDKFDRDWGLHLALTRATLAGERKYHRHTLVNEVLENFTARAKRYFHATEYSVPNIKED